MSAQRQLSQAISEGDGISLIAEVDGPGAAERAEREGAEALLVFSGNERELPEIRKGSSLPILFYWDGEKADALAGGDACVINVIGLQGGAGIGDLVEAGHLNLSEDFEVGFRIADEDQLEETLERYDPEIFILAAPRAEGEEALERVLNLLPDIPAGKLVIADLDARDREQVAELERAGVDAVFVGAGNVSSLVSAAPPEV